MKITILDGYGLNPGDLSWDWLNKYGEVKIYDRTSPSELMERAADADAIFTNKVVINAETLSSLPNLKYIGVLS